MRNLPFSLALGSGLLAIILLAALCGPFLAHHAPDTMDAHSLLSPPGADHWFGTDPLGRDLFSRVVSGLQLSLLMGLGATAVAALPGVILGMASGYYREWVDWALSRSIDVLLSLPGLLLAVVLIARLGPSMTTTLVALGVTGIPTFFRVVRGETLSLAKQPFIEASVALGLPARSIIFRHLLPNLSSSILVLLSMRVGIFLLMGSGLSFIGLGAQPPQSELGALLACGKEYYDSAWWTAVFPGVTIVLAVLGFNLFGEGLREHWSM